MTQTIAPIKSLSLEEFYTYDDGTSTRYELVDGELNEMPTESPLNCDVARELLAQLLRFVPAKLLSYKEIMLEVSGRKVRVPDLMILGKECKAALVDKTRGTITHDMPAPLVAIEVVSPGKVNADRDYRFKRSEYAARGISEYWIIDPNVQMVTILTLVEGFYEETFLNNEDKITSIAFPELEIRVSSIFS
jgi:Uma2 family endonuclease